MNSLFTATVGPILRQAKSSSLSPVHVLALIATIIQSSTILFMPSSSSSGIVPNLRLQAVSHPRTLPTPTTKTPTPTTPSVIVENPGSLGLYLALGLLVLCILSGFVTVYSIGRKHADPNRPPPRRNSRRGKRSSSPPPPPPPPSDPTENDDTKDDESDSNPENSGNNDDPTGNDDSKDDDSDDSHSNPENGDGDEDGDDNNDTTDDPEADDSQNDDPPYDEPDPEDPPPPSQPTFNEDDDERKVTLYGPLLSLLYFLIGASAGLLTRLVSMNADQYRRQLHHLLRNITSRLLGPFGLVFFGSSTMQTPYYFHHRHQPFVFVTAQPRLTRRRTKISVPRILGRISFKYIPESIARVSRAIDVTLPPSLTNIFLKILDAITKVSHTIKVSLPPTFIDIFSKHIPEVITRVSRVINVSILPTLTNIFFKDIPNTVARVSRMISVSLPPALTVFYKYIPDLVARVSHTIDVSLPPTLTDIFVKHIPDVIARFSRTVNVDTVRFLVNWLINALTEDLVVVEACISIVIDRVRALDATHGASLRLIAGCVVLVLVVLEVYYAEPPCNPTTTTPSATVTPCHEDNNNDIFPFADVDLPLEEDSEGSQLGDLVLEGYYAELPRNSTTITPSATVTPCYGDNDDDIFPFADVDLPLEEDSEGSQLGDLVLEGYYAELPRNSTTITPSATVTPCYEDNDDDIFPFADVDLPLEEDSGVLQLGAEPTEDNANIFPFHDVDLPLVEAEPNNHSPGTIAAIANLDINVENINSTSADEIEPPATEPEVELEVEQPTMAIEHSEVTTDCSTHVGQAEMLEANQESHDVNEDGLSPSTSSNEDSISDTDSHVPATQDVQSEELVERMAGDEDSVVVEDEASVDSEEDFDAVLECVASLFDLSSTAPGSSEEESASDEVDNEALVSPCIVSSDVCNNHSPTEIVADDLSPSSSNSDVHVLDAEVVQSEVMVARTLSGEESHTGDEANIEEDPDMVLECLAGLFDSSATDESSSEEEIISDEVVSSSVSSCRVSGGVCVRAFTSCETFAEMFGFENEKPLEFLRPLPARLERLLPPCYIFPHTPARYFTLGAPPATPTTPYSRWEQEGHTSTPFIPSPFGPRTPLRTPPTIVIPSPTSSEGTQPPDDSESPAAIRTRRLDRKWAKIMAKRQRNEARNFVPRVRIDESFSSSLASDTSIRSFFDPHASINRSIRDAEPEPEPIPAKKWKPRGPGDPAPRQRRRWRNKDVLVGAGEDEGYGAVGVAVD